MRRNMFLAVALLTGGGLAIASEGPHWGYAGAEGPEHWGSLDPHFSVCQTGKNQSPVDLTGFVEARLPRIGFHYSQTGDGVINNGHTIQVNQASGSSITLDGRDYALKQYHFHAPSENRIRGEEFPLEAHLVHADADGNLAVIAVMFRQGNANQALAASWAVMPEQAKGEATLSTRLSAEALLPKNRDYYRFNGSLTTPPCSEGVKWLVMKTPVTASAEQIDKFAKVMGHPNNRPVQPVNARLILQ